VAMALDAAGDVYVAGTAASGQMAATGGAAFATAAGGNNSFVAKLDANLNVVFVSYCGGGGMQATAVAATADAVFATGNIYGATLPVTASAILQQPAAGTVQNGFVERFSADGRALMYATYLTGQGGITAPTAIASDAADEAYVAGYTSASGTLKALVPEMIGTEAGFLTKLTSGGDGIVFSTFVSGGGAQALAMDATATHLLMTGSVAAGGWPVTSVAGPLVGAEYQALVTMPVDGSAVTSAVLLAPGTQTTLAADGAGNVWVAGTMSAPLLPTVSATQEIGTAYAMRMNAAGVVDRVERFGGMASANLDYRSAAVTLLGAATDGSGNLYVAGGFAPETDSSYLATESFDLPLVNAAAAALPNTVRDALPMAGSCNGQCLGGAAYLAGVAADRTAPALALSVDGLPNLTLRNLGQRAATGVGISVSGYTETDDCGTTINAGAECAIFLSGTGPGSITMQSAQGGSYTSSLPANTNGVGAALAVSAEELDFGVVSAATGAVTRTETVTNLGTQNLSFTAASTQAKANGGWGFSVSGTDCTLSGSGMLLAAGGSCHLTFAFAGFGTSANDGVASVPWTVGGRTLLLTAWGQAAALTLSATEIDFGTQIAGQPVTQRYLYVANNSLLPVAHAAATLPEGSAFTLDDACPETLEPGSICRMTLGYAPTSRPSEDATVLALDEGLSVLITGTALPAAAASGAAANPNLAVTPTSVSFANPVVVTETAGLTQQVTVTNTGKASFALGLTVTGDFTETTNCPAALTGGASCAVYLGFSPSDAGARSGLLAVTAGNSSPVYVSLSGTGTAILPVTGGWLEFGDVPIGEPETMWLKVALPLTSVTAATTAPYRVVLVEDFGNGHGQPATSEYAQSATAACTSCWVGVEFTPTAAGAQTGTLTVTTTGGGNAFQVALAGDGVALTGVLLTPLTQDMGPVAVNSTSGGFVFTLTNGATVSVPLTSVSATAPFAITANTCGSLLAAGASCMVTVEFAPTSTGPQTGTLAVVTGLGTVTAALSGYGLADPGVSFTPNALEFSNNGTAATQTITVSNTGTDAVIVGTPSNATTAFAATTKCGTLGACASCTITVSYTPASSLGSDVLTIPVTGTVGASPATASYRIPLTSSYTTEEAGLGVTPEAMDYGPQAVMTAGLVRGFTLSNLTAKTLDVAMALPRSYALTESDCVQLLPGASCGFEMEFVPLTNGAVTGSVYVTGTLTDGSAVRVGLAYLQGYGVGSASLGVSGSTLLPGPELNFGNILSGRSAAQTLTLTNQADRTLHIRRVTSEWPFTAATNCTAALASAATCSVTVTYSPLYQLATGAEAAPRADAGTVVIESDAATSPDVVELAGGAIAVSVGSPVNTAPVAAYTLSTGSLTYAATAVGSASAAQTVTLTNTGTVALTVLGATTTTDYLESDNCTGAIAPGGTCALTVEFAPQSEGVLPSALEIATTAATALEYVSLNGTGAAGALSLSPTTLGFGAQNLNTTTTLPVTVTNTGTQAVSITAVAAAAPFAAGGNCTGAALQPGAICTLQIAFTPTAMGAATGTVSIANTAGAVPLGLTVTGSGVMSQLVAGATALDFGSVSVGTSGNHALTLTNLGTGTVSGITLTMTGDYSVSQPCAANALNSGAGCTVQISFTPTATGSRTGTLTVTSSDPTSPIVIALVGVGTATGGFTLTGAANSQTVFSGQPAVYTMTVTPTNGFTGTVAMGCVAASAAPNASCSLSAATASLASGAVSFKVTINTVTEQARLNRNGRAGVAICCLLLPSVFLLRCRTAVAMMLICLAVAVPLIGCGSGTHLNVLTTPAGTYPFQVTATSVGGVAMTQTVNLTLTVQ